MPPARGKSFPEIGRLNRTRSEDADRPRRAEATAGCRQAAAASRRDTVAGLSSSGMLRGMGGI